MSRGITVSPDLKGEWVGFSSFEVVYGSLFFADEVECVRYSQPKADRRDEQAKMSKQQAKGSAMKVEARSR